MNESSAGVDADEDDAHICFGVCGREGMRLFKNLMFFSYKNVTN